MADRRTSSKIVVEPSFDSNEDAIREEFATEGLDITKIEEWPVERINRVPQNLKAKLVPPLKAIFQGFRKQLKTAGPAGLSGTRTGR